MGMIIENPGIYTTVQDEGRFGYEQFGVSPAGPMDRRAFHIANLLVGNDRNEAVLEMTILGAEIKFDSPAVIAVTGADMEPLRNGLPIAMYQTVMVSSGDVLRMQVVKSGCRTYLAVAGGLSVPMLMGSRSTLVKNKIGGVEGRILKKGDHIDFGQQVATEENLAGHRIPPEKKQAGSVRVRVIMGPQDDCFTDEGKADFLSGTYQVTGESDRMGYRLKGPVLRHVTDGNIISDGIVMGSIQVPPAGQPIVMMADCQSIGGYTKIGTVIRVDLPLMGQCKAGDEIRFEAVDLSEAHRLYGEYETELQMLQEKMKEPVSYKEPKYYQISVEDRSFFVQVEEHS